jgi:hypothetical protein
MQYKFSVTKSRGECPVKRDRARCLQEVSLFAMSTVISLFPSHENLRGRRRSEHEYETTVILLTCANDRGCMYLCVGPG